MRTGNKLGSRDNEQLCYDLSADRRPHPVSFKDIPDSLHVIGPENIKQFLRIRKTLITNIAFLGLLFLHVAYITRALFLRAKKMTLLMAALRKE